MLFQCNWALGGERNGKVENGLNLSKSVIGRQIDFGLEISMNDTN
jgi:hypothetical protein